MASLNTRMQISVTLKICAFKVSSSYRYSDYAHFSPLVLAFPNLALLNSHESVIVEIAWLPTPKPSFIFVHTLPSLLARPLLSVPGTFPAGLCDPST